jgi:phosphoribosylanthranilate isomerase
MSLKTFVKISNVSNLSDARYCAGMGVEMLGFMMDENSLEYVEPQKFEEIKSWIAGVKIVGETQSADYQQVKQFIQTYEVDYLQISESSLLPEIKGLGKPIILQLDFDSAYLKENLEKYAPFVEMFLIEGDELSDLACYELKEIAQNYSILLSFGITENNVNELLDSILSGGVPLKGIALKGSQELRPGYKEFDELMNILEKIEVD